MHPLEKKAKEQGTPLIEGSKVTFVWLGKTAPKLLGDWIGWDEETDGVLLRKVAPEVWTYSCQLPSKAYLEYRFFDGKEFFTDPLNPNSVYNGWSGYNSMFYTPKASISPWIFPNKGIGKGQISQFVIEDDGLIIGGKRKVTLYAPPGKKPATLLVVWDGPDYLHRGGIIPIVENLMTARMIPPLALALVDNAHASRMIEYNCSEAAVLMLTRLVLPLAQKHLRLLNIRKNPGSFGVLGASMGGLMAAYAAVRLPKIFGHVLSQSGAFIEWDSRPVLWDLLDKPVPLSIKFWLDVGKYDFLYGANRSFKRFLEQKGYLVKYQEYIGAHNYNSWRNELADGLINQFGS